VADAAAAGAKMASDDGRSNALDFAPHAPQQALLFPPAYEGSEDAPVRRKGPDAIQRTNTRFAPPPPPLWRGRSSSAASSDGSSGFPDLSEVGSRSDASAEEDRGLVAMTPRIVPGGEGDPGGASPLITWGELAAAPRMLEEPDRRQQLGRALDARAQRRRKAPPAPSPLRAALDARKRKATGGLRASYTPRPGSSSRSSRSAAPARPTPRPSPMPSPMPSPTPSPMPRGAGL